MYEGDFMSGVGRKSVEGQYTQIGNFKENLLDGIGMLESASGAQMLGQWTQGQFREGYFIEDPQIWYFGQIQDGKPDGKGFKVHGNSMYDGYFREGAMAGNGVLINSRGRAYCGHFEDNQRHGKFVIIQDDLVVEATYINGNKDKNLGDIPLNPDSD